MMNENQIITDGWSNKESEALYVNGWPDEPGMYEKYSEACEQCGQCSFFAKFNSDWGLCCLSKSRHHLETVFEHFSCPAYVGENWKAHSFDEREEYHCHCG